MKGGAEIKVNLKQCFDIFVKGSGNEAPCSAMKTK